MLIRWVGVYGYAPKPSSSHIGEVVHPSVPFNANMEPLDCIPQLFGEIHDLYPQVNVFHFV